VTNLEFVSPASQDYVKSIYALESQVGGSVGTTALAERLAVSAASASAMVRKLADAGLVEHTRYHGVRLTERGRRVALEVVRHHRLLETFLVQELGMSWDRVHAEAEVLEHVLSEALEQRIAEKLGHPARDPHGDPIPSAQLEVEEQPTERLEDLSAGACGRFVRVSDADPAMLSYLANLGIAPGDGFEVLERQPFGGPLAVRFGDRTHTIGGRLAASMRMEVA
jgi:DtxR family transcriptional regulator, Mn-dependent transcriptional regulator